MRPLLSVFLATLASSVEFVSNCNRTQVVLNLIPKVRGLLVRELIIGTHGNLNSNLIVSRCSSP